MNKVLKRVIVGLLCVVLVLLLVVGAYIAYIAIQYNRIDDKTPLDIEKPVVEALPAETELSIVSYNIGFGAYDHDFSFFMDSGKMKDGTKVSGKNARAQSLEIVMKNTNGAIAKSKELNADFYFFQEVDKLADRSWKVDQSVEITNAFTAYSSIYASNFHSAFLAYPFHEPHGAVEAGLFTLSRYNVKEAIRRSYPVDNSFPTKFFDLDRCFSLHRLPVEGGGELVLINSHMSAYDKGGIIRALQMRMMADTLETERAAGNWVIMGGDFNHALGQTVNSFPSQQEIPEWVFEFDETLLPEGFSVVHAANNNKVASCRSTDLPYTEGVNYSTVLDGFIVSDNIEAAAINIDTGFDYSDHNPVQMTFILK